MKTMHFKKLIIASGLSFVMLFSGCGALGINYDFKQVEETYSTYNNTEGQSVDSLQQDFDKSYDADNTAGDVGVVGQNGVGFNNKISNDKDNTNNGNTKNNNNTVVKNEYPDFFKMYNEKDSTESDKLTTFKVLNVISENEIVFAYQTFQYADVKNETYPDTPVITAKIVDQKMDGSGKINSTLLWEYTYTMSGDQLKKYKDGIKDNGVYSTFQTVFFQTLYYRDDMNPVVEAYAVLKLADSKVVVDYIPAGRPKDKNSVDITDAVKQSYKNANSENKYNNYEITGFSICGSVPNNFEVNLDMSMSNGSDTVDINADPDDEEVNNSSMNFLTRIKVGHGRYTSATKNANFNNQKDFIKENFIPEENDINKVYDSALESYPDTFGSLEVDINKITYGFKYRNLNDGYNDYIIEKDSDKKSDIRFGDYIFSSGDEILYILEYDLQYTGQTRQKITIEGEKDEKGNKKEYSVKLVEKRDYRIEATYMSIETQLDSFPDTVPLYNKVCIDFLEDEVDIIDANMTEHKEITDFSTDTTIVRVDTRFDDAADKFIIFVEDESKVYLYYYDPKKQKLEAIFDDDGIPSAEFNLGKPAPEPEPVENDETRYSVGDQSLSIDDLKKQFASEFATDSGFNLSQYTTGSMASQTDINAAASGKQSSVQDLTPKDVNDVVKESLGDLGNSNDLDINNIISNSEQSSKESEDVQQILDNKKKEEETKKEEAKKENGETSKEEKKPAEDKDVKLTDSKDPYNTKEMSDELNNENTNTSSLSNATKDGDGSGTSVEEYNTSHEVLSADSFIISNGNIYVYTLNSGIIKYNPQKKYYDEKKKEKEKPGFDIVNAHSMFMLIGDKYYIGYEDQDGSYTYNDIAKAQRIPKNDIDLSKKIEVNSYTQ